MSSPFSGIRFDRNELAGAFGDLGTDLPLIIGMIAASGIDGASVLLLFGALQIFSGLWYRMPMPVQPLKAFAAIVIAQRLPGGVIYGGGLAIGVLMLLLSVTGLITWLARIIPKPVIRGIQLGLGLQLATLALREYVPGDGVSGYVLAILAFGITVALLGNRTYPPALIVIALGVLYGLFLKLDWATLPTTIGFTLPQLHVPTYPDILTGLVLLALPQIPLSLGNSVLATRQIIRDHYPEREVGVRQISFTYSLMNLIAPFFSGIPVCHGSGGMAGHYAFCARTGGSVVIYGLVFLVLGLFFSGGFAQIVQIFPLPMLGVLLLFEGLALASLSRDLVHERRDWAVALLTGIVAGSMPYGFLIGLVLGTTLYYLAGRNLIGFGK
ncbi:putative sulfate/molybdate transporter [soil metagenome]